jgi:hypothetical protein
LTEEAYYSGIGELRKTSINFSYDDEQVWRLNLSLFDKGLDASFSVHDGSGHWLVPLTDDLQFSRPKQVYAVIRPEELAAELDEPDVDLADLVARYKPEKKKQKTVWDTQERGDADEARSWIAEADIDEGFAARLTSFVGRFEGATFVRESDELLDYFARSRGPARHYSPWMKISFPEWIQTWRKTLAWADIDEESAFFIAEHLDLDLPAESHEGPLAFTLQPMGRADSDFAQALINRHLAYPIGWGGEEAEWVLAVDLREEAGRDIFVVRAEEVYRWDFDPFGHRLFDGPAAMFDAVDRLVKRDECEVCPPAETLGNWPPKVPFDLDAHQERGGADQARDWIEASSLSSSLKESLASFVDDFPELTYVRDTERSLEYYEVINDARFPEWYRELRKTVCAGEWDGHPVGLIFGNWMNFSDTPFWWGPNHVIVDMGHKLIGEYDHYAVLTSQHDYLTIGLETDDLILYWSMVDDVSAGDFSPVVKYLTFGKALDAVTAIRAGDTTIERG